MSSSNYNFILADSETKDKDIIDQVGLMLFEFNSEYYYPHPPLSKNIFRMRFSRPPIQDKKNLYMLFKLNNKPMGICEIILNVGEINRHFVFIRPFIIPEFRKQGFGNKLIIEVLKLLPSETKILALAIRSDKNHPNFEQNKALEEKIMKNSVVLHAKIIFNTRGSSSHLKELKPGLIYQKAKSLLLEADKKGYLIFFIENNNFTLDKIPFSVKEYITLVERVKNDMPREGVRLENETLAEERFFNEYKYAKEEKMTNWVYVAIEKKTQKPIAYTETRIWMDTPEVQEQMGTGVLKDHRGNKLGLTLKFQMLNKLLTDPLTKERGQYWRKMNAVSNKWMIAINDELGYQEDSRWNTYEFNVEKLKLFLGNN